jgi:glycosyltransferase involved in cell wall biosynthesis
MGARSAETVGIEISNLLKQHPNLPVRFVGKVDEHTKQRVLSDADVFVFPTYYPLEGHPWVIVEAMAASLPIISCDQGCIIESVIDGDNGFIVPKHDPESLMETMLRFAENSDMLQRMGDRSRIVYEEQFTESVMVNRLNRAFENAVRSQQ